MAQRTSEGELSMKSKRVLFAAVCLCLSIPALATAAGDSDVRYRGWGPRIGLSLDPDQVDFGAHVDFGNFARHVRFQPNVEIGVGDHLTMFMINFEAAYRFQSRWDVWTPYVGGGPGIVVGHWHQSFVRKSTVDHFDDSFTDIGFSILGGIERGLRNGDRFFLEARLGFSDAPDLKLTAGWTFFP
jgi:hypothetical protein